VGPAAIDDEAQNDRIDALSESFSELCTDRRVPFVAVSRLLRSSTTWRAELAAGDGSHPGAAGYSELAQLVLEAGWLRWLASDGSP
jgi:acyl-CoA thioesterase I